ncbi:ABC transporter substrate-binding protein [Salicola sp. Rm-C-2C1-2]|uniref:ABC transporter substrate-binding protein n=1 Tax=Salicola sp. Rm-C-2C1-2 TaxID=3141321 RepID=UPI0032E3B6AB
MNGNRWKGFGIGTLALAALLSALPAGAEEIGPAEQPDLKLGFIKLTEMAPLAIAKEKNFFFDEGLFVDLEAQSNWRVLENRMARGARVRRRLPRRDRMP